jgi:hypothetical protein
MAVRQVELCTVRGDRIVVSLFTHADEVPSILISIVDADNTVVPTAELLLPEAGQFRDSLRELCEEGARGGVRSG